MQFTREEQIRRRLNWFIEAKELGSISRAYRNCGSSRKAYYKWWNIYQESWWRKSIDIFRFEPYYIRRTNKEKGANWLRRG